MAKINTLGMTANKIAMVEQLLHKCYKTDMGVLNLQQIIEKMPDTPKKEVIDGMIDYSRSRFNRLNGFDQKRYMDRLKSKRYYVVDGMIVPKTIFDAIPGVVTRNVDEGVAV